MTDSTDPTVRKFRPNPDQAVPLQTLLDQQGDLTEAKASAESSQSQSQSDPEKVAEVGGRRSGLDPTRYGDWEKDGRCIDF